MDVKAKETLCKRDKDYLETIEIWIQKRVTKPSKDPSEVKF